MAIEAPASELNIEMVSLGKLVWINVERPTESEIDYLRRNFSFHPLDLDDCLSKIQRPKIDEYDDYLFIVLHFPVYNKRARVTISGEVDIFIGASYVITVHNGDLRPLNRFYRECASDEKAREASMSQSSSYLLYQLVDRLVDSCFPILNKIAANIERVDENIFSEDAKGTVRELSVIRRDIIAFRRIIKPQLPVIASLERKDWPFLKEELEVYWGNIADHLNRIWDILEDYRDVVEGLAATNDSLTSYRMNEVIKVLTIISTIMLPLAVISSIYGMNISVLPFADSQHSFLITLAIMGATVGVMLWFFRFRQWI
ncbi:MAG: magnesium/cobalt transporter CorA [Chloroflexi bacterium]|nr:magnesium/cobalt transporter CorA [Chloroflexota bacterium]